MAIQKNEPHAALLPEIERIANGHRDATEYAVDDLARMCEVLNAAYRKGAPLVSDRVYDDLFIAGLQALAPEHPFLSAVEPEGEDAFQGERVRHARPMLSTAKAYNEDEVSRFFVQVTAAAHKADIPPERVLFRATAKLDGIAGMDREDGLLTTRGDGLAGVDITHLWQRGLVVENDGARGQGPGEIVLVQQFFRDEIEGQYDDMKHPRNFIAGFAAADTAKPHHLHAARRRAIVFVPYTQLPEWRGTAQEFRENADSITRHLRDQSPYLTDGVVLEVATPELCEAMGATSHHHRWMLALKSKGETARTVIENIRLQTGRTGRVTPILEIRPVRLDGAEIRNVTAHTVATLEAKGLGVGAEIEIIRAGEVIPKLERVIQPAPTPMKVSGCPSCGHSLETEGEYKVCPNTAACPAQAESRLRHWFHTLGNADLFGPVAVAKLVEAGKRDLCDVYDLTEADFRVIGFGPGQSANLVAEVERSRTESVQDWRFLAAFGIRHLGRGDSRRLLAVYPLESLNDITPEAIQRVQGFGELTSPAIAESLRETWPVIADMMALGFNLERTPLMSEQKKVEGGRLAGEHIVFTGKLELGTRSEVESMAAAEGALVQSSVNGKTTMLVYGDKAGSKLKKAQAMNDKAGREVVKMLTEADFHEQMRAPMAVAENPQPAAKTAKPEPDSAPERAVVMVYARTGKLVDTGMSSRQETQKSAPEEPESNDLPNDLDQFMAGFSNRPGRQAGPSS